MAYIKPQDGFQVQYLSSPADITIGGGAAGVGKSWCMLAAALRHKDVDRFNSITFRRTTEQIRNPGSLWDKSNELYPQFGFKANDQQLEWRNAKKSVVFKFAHLQYEKDVYSHDGSEYCLIGFDELQHFSKKQFIYLLSRNRSTCGVRPYVLATCNPDPDSFLAKFLEWWIDQDEKLKDGRPNPNFGFPIKERIGKIRYLVIYKEEYYWANSKKQLIEENPEIFNNEAIAAGVNPNDLIKSVTFISGSIYDNKELLSKDPGYLGNLMSQDDAEKARLLFGNWKVRSDQAGMYNSQSIVNMFDNPYPSNTTNRYITCDAARFGDDLCTIFVWYGWKVVKLVILTKSDPQEIIDAIEAERERFSIIRAHVIVDQDGVGGGVVKGGRYVGFHGGHPPLLDPGTYIKENYENRNTQFDYRFSEKVNNEEVSIALGNNNIVVDGIYSTKVKIKGKVYQVLDLIKADFRSVKKGDNEDGKKTANKKEDRRKILSGRSPDFYDGMKLREWYSFNSGEIRTATANRKQSILDKL